MVIEGLVNKMVTIVRDKENVFFILIYKADVLVNYFIKAINMSNIVNMEGVLVNKDDEDAVVYVMVIIMSTNEVGVMIKIKDM